MQPFSSSSSSSFEIVIVLAPLRKHGPDHRYTEDRTLSVDEDVLVTENGDLHLVGGSDLAAINVDVPDYTSDMTIDGKVSLQLDDQSSAAAISFANDLSGNLVNTGTITALMTGSNRDLTMSGVAVYGDLLGTIDNHGAIDVQILSDTYDASAAGIYVSGNVGADARIDNSGEISVSASVADDSSAMAYGIQIDGDMAGVVVNTGKILVDAANGGSDTVIAAGVYVDGTLSGTIDNQDLIEVTASSDTSEASAYGIYAGNVDADGVIDNSGTIRVEASTITDSTASAYGIYVYDMAGTITNSGLVDVLAQSGTDDATAYGLFISGTVDGTVRNTDTGEIRVLAQSADTPAHAWGIYVGSNNGVGIGADGLIENAGLIDVAADNPDSAAYAYGVDLSGDIEGTFRNTSTGVIHVEANAGSGSASAYGLYLSGQIDGLIDNQGVIEVAARSHSSAADVWGIFVNDSLYGEILNSGRISVLGESLDNGSNDNVTAYGVYISGGVTGLLENTGTIESTVSADEYYGSAYGIYVGNGGITPDGRVSNSGKITVEADVGYSYAGAQGIWVNREVAGVLENLDSGEITVTATSDTSAAYAWGMYARTLSTDGRVKNAGTVTVNAYGDTEGNAARAIGIDILRVNGGRLENSGTIDVLAEAGSGDAYAYGMTPSYSYENGEIVNSGRIHADAWSTDGSADAYGVYLTSFNGTFTNTGAITAHEEGGLGDAIYASGESGLLRLVTKGWIEGLIVPSGDVDVDVIGAKGGSVHWTVDDRENGGSYTVNDTGYNGVPVAVRYNEGSVEFATFDASGLAALRQGAADAGFVGADVVAGQASAAAVAGAPQATRGPVGSGGFTPFVSGSFKSATYGGDSVTLDQDVDTTAGVVGGTFASDSGLAFGLAVGALRSEADVTGEYGTSSETSSTGGIASVGVAGTSGALRFAAAISAGQLSHDTLRTTNNNLAEDGLQTNDASYDSDFVAAQLGLSGRFELASGMTLVPMTALRYARHSVDGYVEGGPDGAEVDAQSFGVFEGEVGLGVEKAMGAGVVSGGLSYVSRSFNGDETTSVGLIGDTIGVPTDLGVGSFAKLSIGYTSDFGAATQMRVGAETLFSSDGFAGGKVTGEIRFSF